MSTRYDLADVIDRCLDDLVTGRGTLSECLDRYPEHRAALEPVLRAAAALGALPRHAEHEPSRVRRAALMELIRETPQQRRGWIPALSGLLSGGLLPRLAAAAAPVAIAAAIGVFMLVSVPATPAAASTLTIFAGATEEQVGGAWRPLADGAALREGARVRTTADGYALLTFPDGSTASLDPSTEIAIERLAGSPRTVQLRQHSGRLWNDVVSDSRPGAVYEVRALDARVVVQGTVFETAIDGEQASVATAQGSVDVLVGNDRVSVPPGQIVRAQGQRVSERATVQPADSVVIDAPFAATLLSERGEATGARLDGAIFRQIRGVTTSNPGEGPQRFEFQRLDPGTYTFVLQRFHQGAGDIVLDLAGGERRVAIDEATGTAQVRVHVEVKDGVRRLTIDDDAPRPASVGHPAVRLVETERTKKPADIAAQRAAADDHRRRSPAASTTPTVTTSANQTQATPALEAFASRLREGILRNDPAAIRAALHELVDGADASNAHAQIRVLAALLNNGDTTARVSAALAADATLRARLLEAGEALPGDQRERFRRAILGGETEAEAGRQGASATPRLPTPGRTNVAPVRTRDADDGTATATPTPTASPTRETDARSRPPLMPSPAVVDGFTIRLRIALAMRNDEEVRRTLADITSGDDSTTASRLAALAELVTDPALAASVTSALEGEAATSLRSRLRKAIDEDAPEVVRQRLRTLIDEGRSPTATASSGVTITPTVVIPGTTSGTSPRR